MTKRVVLLVVVIGGCGQIKDAINPERVRRREAAAQEQRDRDAQAAQERRKRAEREAELDRMCFDPQTTYQEGFCAAREREKDREVLRRHYEREDEVREHEADLHRQEVEMERREVRRRNIERAFPPPPPPAVRAPTNCSSLRTGDLVTTTCY